MLIPSPTSSEALGRPHRAPNFCISGEGQRRVEGATSGPGEVIGITGGRSLEVVVTFPMPPDASDDLPSQPHMLTRLCQPNPTSLQPFVPAHRTTACDDWLTHGPIMHARPERGLLG